MRNFYNIYSKLLSSKAKKKFGLLIFLTTIGAILETLGITVIISYISLLNDPKAFIGNQYVNILTKYININSENLIYIMSLIIFLLFFLKNLYLWFLDVFRRKYILDECFTTMKKVYREYLNKPYTYFLNHHSQDIANVIHIYVSKAYILLQVLMNCFSEILITGFLIILMLQINIILTLMVLVLFVGMLLLFKAFSGRKMETYGYISSKNYDQIIKSIVESVNGIQDIKLLQRENTIIKKFDNYRDGNVTAEVKKESYLSFENHFMEVFCIGFILISIFVLMNFGEANAAFTALYSLAMIILRIRPGVNRINSYTKEARYYIPYLKKLDEALLENENFEQFERNQKISNFSFENKIKFENVSFSYDTHNFILKDVNLEIIKGSVLGIKGISGGGKTTFANVLLGLLHPDYGKIFVDDKNINDMLDSWFSIVSYIPQSVFLLDGTILDNIVFYRDIDEQKVWDALEKAHLKDFVKTLPEGIFTQIGERGIRLSGGQRQRIAIARAIYNDAQVFVFDEPTSSLDELLEQDVMDTIFSLEDRTIILIAHRLNTLKKCDKLYEVIDNRIVEVTGN